MSVTITNSIFWRSALPIPALRIIERFLKAGVLEDGVTSASEQGTSRRIGFTRVSQYLPPLHVRSLG
jgi:hypothetical protein